MSSLPTLQYVESFTVTGFTVRTQNSAELNEQTAKLPSLWQQFRSSDMASSGTLFEVYSDFESDADGLYTVTVGTLDADNNPNERSSVAISSGHYLAFQGEGPMPFAVFETWKQIWSYFETETNYQRSFVSDFEAYSSPNKVTIYIGVK